MAKLVSSWSKDRSTKVGAVLVSQDNYVLGVGYNGFPRGVDDDIESRHDRPSKYDWTEHAERNAIYNAARHGISLDGASMFIWLEVSESTQAKGICMSCCRAIIQSGVKRVFINSETCSAGVLMLKEGGVKCTVV